MLLNNLREKINLSMNEWDKDLDQYKTEHPYRKGEKNRNAWLISSFFVRKKFINNFLDYIEKELKNGKEYIFTYSSKLSLLTQSSSSEIEKMEKEGGWRKNIVSINNLEAAEKNLELLIKTNWLYFPIKSGLVIDNKEQNLKFINEDIDKLLLLENKEKLLNLNLLKELMATGKDTELSKQVMKILFKNYFDQDISVLLEDFLSLNWNKISKENTIQKQKDFAEVLLTLETLKTKSTLNQYLLKIVNNIKEEDVEKTLKLAQIVGYIPYNKDEGDYLIRLKKYLSKLSIEEIKELKKTYDINLYLIDNTSYLNRISFQKFLQTIILKRELTEKVVKEEDLFEEKNSVVFEKNLKIDYENYKIILGYMENIEGEDFAIKNQMNTVNLTFRSDFEITLSKKDFISLLKNFFQDLKNMRKDTTYLVISREANNRIYKDFLNEIKNLQREQYLQAKLENNKEEANNDRRKKI